MYCTVIVWVFHGLIQGLINYKADGQLIFVWHWHCIPEDLMVHLQLLEPKYKLIKVLKTSESRDLASTERVLFSTYTCDFLALEMAWAGCFSTTVSFSFSPSVLHPFAQSTEKVQRMNMKTRYSPHFAAGKKGFCDFIDT